MLMTLGDLILAVAGVPYPETSTERELVLAPLLGRTAVVPGYGELMLVRRGKRGGFDVCPVRNGRPYRGSKRERA